MLPILLHLRTLLLLPAPDICALVARCIATSSKKLLGGGHRCWVGGHRY